MKSFSQYINSNEDCGCQQPVEEQIGTFVKGALKGVGSALGSAVAELGGPLGKAAFAGGQEAIEKRKRGAELLDREVINAAKRVADIKKELARNIGKPGETEIRSRLAAAELDFEEIKNETDVERAEKRLAMLRKQKADALRSGAATP